MKKDAELKADVAAELAWEPAVNDDHVRVEVEDAWVTLTGEVDWPYQFSSAEQCIRPLTGVRSVTSVIDKLEVHV